MPNTKSDQNGLSTAEIIGIVAGVIFFIVIIILLIYLFVNSSSDHYKTSDVYAEMYP